MSTDTPKEPRIEEQVVARGINVYRHYMVNEEPQFDQSRLRQLVGDAEVDAIRPPTLDLLRHLFSAYVRDELEPKVLRSVEGAVAVLQLPGKTEIRRRRFEMLRRYGGGCLGYTTLSETDPLPS